MFALYVCVRQILCSLLLMSNDIKLAAGREEH